MLRKCGILYKSYKNTVKTKYYYAYDTDEKHLAHKPARLRKDEWMLLVNFWSTPEAQDVVAKNKNNKAKQRIHHTAGSKSFAQHCHEEMMKRPYRGAPNLIEMFARTHTKKDGTPVDEHSKLIMLDCAMANRSDDAFDSNSTPSINQIYKEILGVDSRNRPVGVGGFGVSTSQLYGSTPKEKGVKQALTTQKVSELENTIVEMERRQKEKEEEFNETIRDLRNETSQLRDQVMLLIKTIQAKK